MKTKEYKQQFEDVLSHKKNWLSVDLEEVQHDFFEDCGICGELVDKAYMVNEISDRATVNTMMVCTDCANFIANGELPEHITEE